MTPADGAVGRRTLYTAVAVALPASTEARRYCGRTGAANLPDETEIRGANGAPRYDGDCSKAARRQDGARSRTARLEARRGHRTSADGRTRLGSVQADSQAEIADDKK